MASRDDEREAQDERRKEPRLEVSVAARLDCEFDGLVGMTQDLSKHGARMLSMARLKPGQVLDLWFLTPEPTREVHAKGRILRAAPFSVSGPWCCVMAVEFEEPLSMEPREFLGSA